jgi:hypothetical protein
MEKCQRDKIDDPIIANWQPMYNGPLYTRAWGLFDTWYTNYVVDEEAREGPKLIFILTHEGLSNQRSLNEWKTYTTSYMALSG